MVTRNAVLRAMAKRERSRAAADFGLGALAADLGLPEEDLATVLSVMERNGLVRVLEPAEEPEVEGAPLARLTERGRERALSAN